MHDLLNPAASEVQERSENYKQLLVRRALSDTEFQKAVSLDLKETENALALAAERERAIVDGLTPAPGQLEAFPSDSEEEQTAQERDEERRGGRVVPRAEVEKVEEELAILSPYQRRRRAAKKGAVELGKALERNKMKPSRAAVLDLLDAERSGSDEGF